MWFRDLHSSVVKKSKLGGSQFLLLCQVILLGIFLGILLGIFRTQQVLWVNTKLNFNNNLLLIAEEEE